MEHMVYEDKLRELIWLSLEKRRIWRGLIFTLEVIKCRNTLPKEVIKPLTSENFKTHVVKTLHDQV